MMSKDLEKKVDDIDGRVELLIKIVHEMADDKKELIKLVKEQREDFSSLCMHRLPLQHKEGQGGRYSFHSGKELGTNKMVCDPSWLDSKLGKILETL
jgi:hypothetical protein